MTNLLPEGMTTAPIPANEVERLGSVFKLQPQENAGDREHGCIICSQLLIAGSDTAKLLESVDSTFNNVALTVDFTGF
jgi:hypothetical protein